MRDMPSAIHIARTAMASSKGWIDFVEISRKAGGFYRLVADTRHREGNGVKWQAAGIKIEIADENGDGSLADATITIPNVSRIPIAVVETQDELIGADVTVWRQHEDHLDVFVPALSWRFKGLRVLADAEALSLAVGHPAGGMQVPKLRFTKRNFPGVSARGGISL